MIFPSHSTGNRLCNVRRCYRELFISLLVVVLLSLTNPSTADVTTGSNHTSNYAVILSASKYWFNYRHNTNALAIYKLLKDNGYNDDNIILMLADEFIVNNRNPYKNEIYTKPISTYDSTYSIYDPLTTQIDYRNEDVTVQNFLNVLLGKRQNTNGINSNDDKTTTSSSSSSLPVLDGMDEQSNLLIYMTGHGGDEFFKFLDVEELLSNQFSTVLEQMYYQRRFNEILIISDTCQAFTMAKQIQVPNILMIGSSLQGQSSYSHHTDPTIGLGVIEKYTYYMIEYINKYDPTLVQTIQQDLISPYTYEQQNANIGYTDELMQHNRKVNQIQMKDFFTNIQVTGRNKKKQKNMKKKKIKNNNDDITTMTKINNDNRSNTTPGIITEMIDVREGSYQFYHKRYMYLEQRTLIQNQDESELNLVTFIPPNGQDTPQTTTTAAACTDSNNDFDNTSTCGNSSLQHQSSFSYYNNKANNNEKPILLEPTSPTFLMITIGFVSVIYVVGKYC